MKIYVVWKDLGEPDDYYYVEQKEPLFATVDESKAKEFVKGMDRKRMLLDVINKLDIPWEQKRDMKKQNSLLDDCDNDDKFNYGYDEIELKDA